MQTPDGLVVLGPGEGRAHGDITVKVEARETGAGWGAVVVRGDQGTSGRTHVHRGESEAFFILEGDVELWGPQSVTRLSPGTFILVPPDTEHALKVLTDEARWLAIWPPSLDGLLDDLDDARRAGRDDPDTTREIRRRHGVVPGERGVEG